MVLSHLVFLSPCHCLYTHVLQIHLSSQLPHSTFLSSPPKLTSDLELWIELYLLSSSSHRPLLGSTSESTWLVPECAEYWPSLSSPNPQNSLGLTQCRLISTSVLHSPLISFKQPHKFRTPRLETQAARWSVQVTGITTVYPRQVRLVPRFTLGWTGSGCGAYQSCNEELLHHGSEQWEEQITDSEADTICKPTQKVS